MCFTFRLSVLSSEFSANKRKPPRNPLSTLHKFLFWICVFGPFCFQYTACTLSFRPRALPPSSGYADELVSRVAGPFRRNLEHAGHAYQDLLRLRVSGRSNTTAIDSTIPLPRKKTKEEIEAENIHNKARRTFVGDDDYYELLELGDLRWRSTEEDIKKAYRKVSLRFVVLRIVHLLSTAK